MRSGFFTRPRPLVEFDCGSQSTSSVLTSAAASEAARLMAVVVLPTPPFWLATAMTRPMACLVCVLRVRICELQGEINARVLCKTGRVFHVKHSFVCTHGGAHPPPNVSRETHHASWWSAGRHRPAC